MPIPAGFLVPHPPMIIPDVGGGRHHQIHLPVDAPEGTAARP